MIYTVKSSGMQKEVLCCSHPLQKACRLSLQSDSCCTLAHKQLFMPCMVVAVA